MKKVLGTLAVAGLLTGAVSAAEVAVVSPIDVHGGFSAGYKYVSSEDEGFEVTNFLIELSKAPTEGIGFTAAFGYLANNAPITGGNFGLQYGYLTVAPMEGVVLDAGVLATLVGYEVANTYANPNITIARIWAGQPVYYPGARITYTVNDKISVFGEVNDIDFDGDATTTNGAWSIGSAGTIGTVDYVVSYFDESNPNLADIVDVVLSANVGGLDVALNFDYQMGKDDNGYGVALYVTPVFGDIALPIRIESFDDNGSGAYNNKGWDIAITPTYNFGEHGYVRAEVFYYEYDKAENVLGRNYPTGTAYRAEFGYTF